MVLIDYHSRSNTVRRFLPVADICSNWVGLRLAKYPLIRFGPDKRSQRTKRYDQHK